MLSTMPIDLRKVRKDLTDKEIMRASIIAELDAINLYEQMAEMTRSSDLKKVLLDIAREEKTHFGEFLEVLKKLDAEQIKEFVEAREEIEELLG
jgi:rubrerythrin